MSHESEKKTEVIKTSVCLPTFPMASVSCERSCGTSWSIFLIWNLAFRLAQVAGQLVPARIRELKGVGRRKGYVLCYR